MTKPDLMAELAEVVREIEAFRCLPFDLRRSALYTDATHAALDFITTHHAELEAVVRDAARYQFLKSRAYIGVNRHMECLWTLRNIPESAGRFDVDVDQAMHNSAREG